MHGARWCTVRTCDVMCCVCFTLHSGAQMSHDGVHIESARCSQTWCAPLVPTPHPTRCHAIHRGDIPCHLGHAVVLLWAAVPRLCAPSVTAHEIPATPSRRQSCHRSGHPLQPGTKLPEINGKVLIKKLCTCAYVNAVVYRTWINNIPGAILDPWSVGPPPSPLL